MKNPMSRSETLCCSFFALMEGDSSLCISNMSPLCILPLTLWVALWPGVPASSISQETEESVVVFRGGLLEGSQVGWVRWFMLVGPQTIRFQTIGSVLSSSIPLTYPSWQTTYLVAWSFGEREEKPISLVSSRHSTACLQKLLIGRVGTVMVGKSCVKKRPRTHPDKLLMAAPVFYIPHFWWMDISNASPVDLSVLLASCPLCPWI